MIMSETPLPELTRRQEQILALVVRTYTERQEPISSKFLAESYDLGFSSATIRNELAVLDDLGYLSAPHTSSGRIPTTIGYRYFVQRLIEAGDLSQTEKSYIKDKFQSSPMVTEQWMRLAASMLSRTAQTASIVTPPISETSKFKRLELISIQGRLVLMVLVLHGGTVHQRMLNLAEPVPQETLTSAGNRINTLCLNLLANELRIKAVQLPLLEREVVELAAELMERADTNQVRLVYREGLSDILQAFPDGKGAQQAVRFLEERAFLNMILTDMWDSEKNEVQVLVAGEGREELDRLSMVIGRYGVQGQMSGALGLLGPTHINYGRAISTVRYVSSVMTDMLSELYSQPDTLPDNSEIDGD